MTDGDGIYRLGEPTGGAEPVARTGTPGRPGARRDAGESAGRSGGGESAGRGGGIGAIGDAGDPGGAGGFGDPGRAGGFGGPDGAGSFGDPGRVGGFGDPDGAGSFGDPGRAGGFGGPREAGRLGDLEEAGWLDDLRQDGRSGEPGEAGGFGGRGRAGRSGDSGRPGDSGRAGRPGGPGGPPGVRPRRDPWKVLFAVLLILGLLAGATWVLLGSRLLVVREVRVEGLKRVPRAEVTGVAAVPIGTPLARLDTGAIGARVEGVRLVESAEVVRSWPAAVTIRVTERRPVLAVRTGDRYTLVDKVGVPVTRAARVPRGMPVLVVAGPVEGNPGVPVAVSITSRLPETLADRLVAVQITPGSAAITLRLRGGRTVVWGGADRTAQKARVLVGLLRAEPKARHFDVSDPAVAVVK